MSRSSEGKLIALESADDGLPGRLMPLLYRWLREQGIPVEQTGEPTYGLAGTQVRLARQGRLRVDPLALALWEVADRMDHMGREGGILACLQAGRQVLCAHYMLGSCARHLAHADLGWLGRINARCRLPDLTLFVDVQDAGSADTGEAVPTSLRRDYAVAVAAAQDDGQNVVVLGGQVAVDEVLVCCQRSIAVLLGW